LAIIVVSNNTQTVAFCCASKGQSKLNLLVFVINKVALVLELACY